MVGLLLREGQNLSMVTQQHADEILMEIHISTLPRQGARRSQGDRAAAGGGTDRHRRYLRFYAFVGIAPINYSSGNLLEVVS